MLANHYFSLYKLRNTSYDILHETYYSSNPVTTGATGRVITVHDMIHEKFRANFSLQDPAIRFKRLAVGRADHVICISHSTKNDVCEIYDLPTDQVSVVHHGFEKFIPQSIRTEPQVLNLRPFLLYVGSRGGYKNFEGMLRAVARSPALQKTFDVVAFGGGSFT